MPGQVDEAVKEERLARLQALLEAAAGAFNAAQVGRTLPVLFERPAAIQARWSAAAPICRPCMRGPQA
jgi:tRNA-2-methylthio-N6-dimethylallyladenosine synthase